MADTCIIWLLVGLIFGSLAIGWDIREVAADNARRDGLRAQAAAEAWPKEKQKAQLAAALAYNRALADSPQATLGHDDDPGGKGYAGILDTGDGIMARVIIPTINVDLPIYHTITARVLEKGVGHMPDSSLPVGGASTRPVISAHNGLTGAKYFDDLPKLKQGDLIIIYTLGHEFDYRVSDIVTVRPDEVRRFTIERGKDLITLTTCTNGTASRLAVTAHRVPSSKPPYHDAGIAALGIPEALLAGLGTLWLGIGPVMMRNAWKQTRIVRHRRA